MTPVGVSVILVLVFLLVTLLFGFWVGLVVTAILAVGGLFGLLWNIADSMDYTDDM